MNITLKSPVKGNYKKVMAAFDRNLFEALKPPTGEMEIVMFTGSQKGDKVHIRFVKPIKADWISDIVEDQITDDKAWFVDVGNTLPWPLASWAHRHIVEKIDDNNSMIIDDMTFTGRNFLLTLLLYPAIFLGFYPRKRIYKQYFDKIYLSSHTDKY
jgi:ligand-binding SRPBCC domain-containing protein